MTFNFGISDLPNDDWYGDKLPQVLCTYSALLSLQHIPYDGHISRTSTLPDSQPYKIHSYRIYRALENGICISTS
jgi:hypothetical protein